MGRRLVFRNKLGRQKYTTKGRGVTVRPTRIERENKLALRIDGLEREIERLRASRRVLLNLVALQDRENRLRIGALEKENRRLRHKRLH